MEVEIQDLKESSDPHVNKARDHDKASAPRRRPSRAIMARASDEHFVESDATNRDNTKIVVMGQTQTAGGGN